MSVINEYHPKALRKHRVMVERFNSADEIVRVSDSRELRDAYRFNDTRSDLNKGFNGVDSWKEATNLLRYGYQPFVQKLKAKLDFTARGDGMKTAFRNDVVGFAPVVPLAIMGVPNNMINMYKQPVKNKVVNIYFDKVAVCINSVKQIEDACAMFMSALINIEMQGYRVNLYITESHSDGRYVDMMCLKVKDANMALDLQRISFPLAHTAFFRAIGFDWFKRCPSAKITRSGLGTTMSRNYTHDEIRRGYEEIFNEKCIVFEMEEIIRNDEQYIIDTIANANKVYA